MNDLSMFMKKNGKASALLLSLSVSCFLPVAKAADTVMNITGNVIASPCEVNVPAGGLDIDLGKSIMGATLAPVDSKTEWKDFKIDLIKCPVSTTVVTMTMSGTPDATVADMYTNTGTATNLQIELQSSTGTNLGNAKKLEQAVDTASHTTTFNLRTRAYSKKGDVMPGSIIGTVQATFTYR